MSIPRVAAALGAAFFLTATPANAAKPIDNGWYEGSGATAVVGASGRTGSFVIAPACSEARFLATVKVGADGTLVFRGRIASLPTRRDPRMGAVKGTATIRGRFETRKRLQATVRFKAGSCAGRFTRELHYATTRGAH